MLLFQTCSSVCAFSSFGERGGSLLAIEVADCGHDEGDVLVAFMFEEVFGGGTRVARTQNIRALFVDAIGEDG